MNEHRLWLQGIVKTLELVGQRPAITGWGPEELIIGLTVLTKVKPTVHAPHNYAPYIMNSTHKMKTIQDYLFWCTASYTASNKDDFSRETNIPLQDILLYKAATLFTPSYTILLHHETKAIVVVIRGTRSVLDFCTDIALINEPFQDGVAHRGIAHAAQHVYPKIIKELEEAKEQCPSYTNIVFTGHSLGAGVASLLAIRTTQENSLGILYGSENVRVNCIGFATPACVSEQLAAGCEDYITTIICHDDCVPRLQEANLLALLTQVKEFDWTCALKTLAVSEMQQLAFLNTGRFMYVSQIKKTIDMAVQGGALNLQKWKGSTQLPQVI